MAAAFHYVQLRAFAHETEDPERVRAALRHAAGSDKLDITETSVEGSHKNRILILEVDLKGNTGAKRVFEGLAKGDPHGFRRVVDESPKRLDDNLNFYVRLDKQEAYQGRVVLATGDDAITLRAKIRSYQPKRAEGVPEEVVRDVQAFLEGVRTRAQASVGE